jgi:PAS domain S-box-containing protein
MEKERSSRNNASPLFPIVAVGASAGGLDAFKRFFTELPHAFSFALVFIQHLLAKQKSLLPDLLRSRKPRLEINEISDGMQILPGRVYLNPPGKEVSIKKGSFLVTPRREAHLCLPIDDFLESLSEEVGERSIAVIFSGAGTDGARGIQSIRMAGGTIFVQDPETAEFSGMPLAAIKTGVVDGIHSPEDIAREILKMQGTGVLPISSTDFITPSDLRTFYRLIREKTGYSFDHYKKTVVTRRIRRRMYLHGLSSASDYFKMIGETGSEALMLASDLMIGVTSFFRDRMAWKVLKIEVLRKFAAEDDDSPVRVWTPACATGEEAYSIAIMLRNELDLAGRKREMQIFATDVNETALQRAREGTYPASVAADIPSDLMHRYFTFSENGLSATVSKAIREEVVFARQDLLVDPPFSRLDLIICRNLLIYLEPEAQEKCISIFHYALKNDRYLFLGNAEAAGKNSVLFKSIGHKKCRIYTKVEKSPSPRMPVAVPFPAERGAASSPPRQVTPQPDRQSVTQFVQETMLEEYAPSAIAINQKYEILYHNGPTNRYLRQPRGAPTQNLLELFPEVLQRRIRAAVYRTTHEMKPVALRASIEGYDHKKRQVTLRISRLKEDLFLIVFREKGAAAEQEEAISLDACQVEETAVRQLETELSATREALQSNIEQLKSLNEELQSSNEELQAANEELETSREELQSLNEELITVNSQLQSKIEDEEKINDDLNNFLTSTNIPTIFLDHEFRVKRFTPAMSRIIKLIPSDVGRPIIDMSQENLGPDFIADAKAVLSDLVPIRKEIGMNGAWYVRTSLPYRTSDNRIEGVVVTYNDITELKRAEQRTRHLASFPQFNPNPVIEVDSSGDIVFRNPAAEKVLESLGLDKRDVHVFLPSDFNEILGHLAKKEELILPHEMPIGNRVFGATIHLAPQFNVVRIYAYDITERKRAEEALRKAHDGLELRVRERTRELVKTNEELETEIADRRRAEEVARIERQRLYDVLETLPVYVVLLSEDYHVPFANKFFRERFGESHGKRCFEYLFGRTEPCEICETYSVLKTNAPHHWEWTGPDKRNYDIYDFPFVDADGSRLILEMGIDITEQKKAEAALRELNETLEQRVADRTEKLTESEERFRAAYEQAAVGIELVDLDGKFIRGNGKLNDILGYNEGELDQYTFSRITHPDDLRTEMPLIEQLIAGRIPNYSIEKRYIHKDGHNVWVRVTSSIVRTSRPYRISIIEDITKHKQAEEALRASEQRLARAQEIAHLGSWELDLVNDKLTWSDEVYRIFGLKPQVFKATYEAFLERVHPDDRAAVDSAYSGSVRDEKNSYEIEHRVTQKGTGEIRWVHEKCQHVRDDSGKIIRSLGMVHDITERKQAEDQLKKATEELKRSNAELEQFAYAASHDLREPLRTISAFLRLFEKRYKGKIDEKADEYISFTIDSVTRMDALLNDLLEFSRLGSKTVRMNPVNWAVPLEKAIYNLGSAIEKSGTRITYDQLPTVPANESQITRLFQNLIANAIKFRGERKPVIHIAVKQKDHEWLFSVRDNGIGIEPEFNDRIFVVFQRLHTRQEYEGTGMGLAICKKIVELHGGRIWVESQPGKGSTFYFTIPDRK